MKNSQAANQPNNNPSSLEASFFKQINQDFFCFLKAEEKLRKLKPFFSKKGLSQDIIDVTDAKPDICLEVFHALCNILLPQLEKLDELKKPGTEEYQLITYLKDAWTNFIGSSISKGILWPPEKLMESPQDIEEAFPKDGGEEQVFLQLDAVIESILILKTKLTDYPGEILQRDEIMASLNLVEQFYTRFRNKVKDLVILILANQDFRKNYQALENLLEPKAVMMSDIFDHHWAYRIPRKTAKKLLSLNKWMGHMRNYSDEGSTHRVAALPEAPEPLVYFKANGRAPIQPEKEFMLYSLYRRLQIPVPETALLILTDVFNPLGTENINIDISEISISLQLSFPRKHTIHNPGEMKKFRKFLQFLPLEIVKKNYDPSEILFGAQGVNEDPDYYYAVQASEAVSGKSAKEACKSKETIFEEKAYAEQVIGALLTNPSDGSFKNFKYCPKRKTLISIDNDLIFESEFTENKTINVKSVLYLLPLMDRPIPSSIQTYFTTLDPHLIMLAWLQDLSRKNEEYDLLFERLPYQKTRFQYQTLIPGSEPLSLSDCVQEQVKVDSRLFGGPESDDKPFYPRILVSTNLLDNLTKKLQIIEETLLNTRSASNLLEKLQNIESVLLQNDSVSSQTLFERIFPVIGKYYRELRGEFSDPEKALEALWEEKKGVDLMLNQEQSDSNKAILLPETFFSTYKAKLISGKTLSLDKFLQRQSERKLKNLLNIWQALEELRLLVQEGLTNSQSPWELL